MRFAIKFAYDGQQFHGFARQPNLKTVEGEIIKILVRNDYIKNPKKSIFRFASRTDKNVSAMGNVIAFNTEKSVDNIFSDINNQDDILFYGLKQVGPDFYPRYAKQRIYRYYLKKNRYDIDIIISAASLFTGEHNFSNFARIEQGKNPLRTIENIVIEDTEDFLIIEFYAQNYLWNQIRRIVSTIGKAGSGKLNLSDIRDALEKTLVLVDFGIAPADPLILMDVIYDFNFEYNRYYLEKLKILKEKIIKKI